MDCLRRTFWVAMCILCAGIANAQTEEEDGKLEFSLGVSTAGLRAEAAYRIHPHWALRGFVGGAFTVFGDGSVSDVDYDWKVKLGGYGVVADYYPWKEGFRISGGLFVADAGITANANGDLEIGGGRFEGVAIEGNVEPANDVTPIVSIGYVVPISNRVSLTADVGAIITNGFEVDLRRTGGPVIPPEFIDREEAEFRGQAWEAFPFVGLSLTYSF